MTPSTVTRVRTSGQVKALTSGFGRARPEVSMTMCSTAGMRERMVSSAGTPAQAAAVIGEACAAHKVMTTALVIGSEHASDEVLSKTLASLRPYASMLVIAAGDAYIDEMLAALRA